MAEHENVRHIAAQNQLDENENPPSLNFSSSSKTDNDSFNMINCEPENISHHSKSQDNDFSSAGLPTPEKNSLADSGFHCENLEKTVLPDLVNNSLCESVNNNLSYCDQEPNEVFSADVSFPSHFDKTFNTAQDSSFTVASNTTTTNLEFLLERLTLNSEENAPRSNDLENSLAIKSCALSDNVNNDSHILLTEVSCNDNFNHQNLSNVFHESDISKLNSFESSISINKSIQDTFAAPASNPVPLDETVVPSSDVPLKNDVESLECSASKINSSDCPFNSETSLDDTFKHPFPVPELTNVPNIQNMSEENVFRVNPDDTIDGEEFQDAVQFFKDPSSFQVFENIKTLDLPHTSIPRESLYMNFDPLYKKVKQPVSDSLEEDNKKEILDGNGTENDQINEVTKTFARESLGDNLVSFDSPFKRSYVENSEKENLNQKSAEEENYSVDRSENNQLTKKCTSEVIRESLGGNLVSFDSPLKSLSEKDNGTMKEGDSCDKLLDSPMKSNSVENENKDLNILSIEKEICFDQTFDELIITSSVGNSEENEILNKFSVKEEICEIHDTKNNKMIVNQHISNVPVQDSPRGNLLSFDSPLRSNSTRNSENFKASLLENNQKIYTEEEFQQALKIYELTMQEVYLKKQRELEEKQKALELEALKKLKEKEEKLKSVEGALKKKEMEEEVIKKQKEMGEEALKNGSNTAAKLHGLTELCKALLEAMSELAVITSEERIKIGDLSAKIICLESEKQKLSTDLKTSTEDLHSVENTFSEFHKRYVQCKDMLKTYKDNEDRLKAQVEGLNKKLEEQEQMYSMLQTKMGEIVDKANAEVASAKKGGDAQVAVLKAQLKKSELKVSSLESDLKQVRIENDKLSSICDDLMAKVSEA